MLGQAGVVQHDTPIERDDADALTRRVAKLASVYGRYRTPRPTSMLHREGSRVNRSEPVRREPVSAMSHDLAWAIDARPRTLRGEVAEVVSFNESDSNAACPRGQKSDR